MKIYNNTITANVERLKENQEAIEITEKFIRYRERKLKEI